MRYIAEDAKAIEDMAMFSCGHRAAVATRCEGWFAIAKTDADRLSAVVEAFENFMAAIEQLEMVLYALRQKVSCPGQSFFSAYANINIREKFNPKSLPKQSFSAGFLLHLLHRRGWQQFRQIFGLPTYEEICAHAGGAPNGLQSETAYRRYLAGLRRSICEALRNRRKERLQRSYNKLKHGALVLRMADAQCGILVRRVKARTACSSFILCTPVRPRQETVHQLAENTRNVAKLTSEVLLLWNKKSCS